MDVLDQFHKPFLEFPPPLLWDRGWYGDEFAGGVWDDEQSI